MGAALVHSDNKAYQQQRHEAVKELQTQFYRLCAQAAVSILTPRQRQILDRQKEKADNEQS